MNMSISSEHPQFPSFAAFLWASILLVLFGLGGLAMLVSNTLPTMGPRWVFYFMVVCAVSGFTLPIAFFLNRRFMTNPPASGGAIVREAIWASLFVCIALWLQQGGLLNLVVAVAVGLSFIAIEFLCRLRELSLWKPKDGMDE